MKTKIFIKFALLATIFFAFSFATFSCADLIGSNSKNDSDEKKLIEISGNFCVNGAVPSEIAASLSDDADCNIKAESSSSETESSSINTAENQIKNARTALPEIPASITYKVSATSGGTTVQGEVNQSSKTFTIKLSSGTWTVIAEGFSDSSMAANTKILEGSTQISLTENSVKNDISITLSPVSSGNGKIELTVNFESTTNINSVEMILTQVGSSSPIIPTITGTSSTGNQIKLTNENIPAGVYDAEIKFKSSSGELKYSARETVNIFQNLTTDSWQGKSPYFTQTDGKTEFKITKALVDNFSRKEFYVKGTYSILPGTASDSNSGTYFDPFATVQKAVDTINSINDGTSAYTIKVDGTLTQSTTEGNKDSFVNISSPKTLNLTIEGITIGTPKSGATIDANINRPEGNIGTGGSGRVFCIGDNGNTNTKINVTLKNLTLKGGFFDGNNKFGAGIYLENGNLTLSSVTVTNNTCQNGGGIYVKGGTCQIIDGTISNNNALKGSGIYVAGGTLKISGQTTMSENKSTSIVKSASVVEGTAIYVGKGATAELDGSSGNVNITTADNDNTSLIYLEKGTPGATSTGGSSGNTLPVNDAVLKLGGKIEIGKSNNKTINIEDKISKTEANIKITKTLTSNSIINISYDTVIPNEPIIRGANITYPPTSSDYNTFKVNNKTLGADGNYKESQQKLAPRHSVFAPCNCKSGH